MMTRVQIYAAVDRDIATSRLVVFSFGGGGGDVKCIKTMTPL